MSVKIRDVDFDDIDMEINSLVEGEVDITVKNSSGGGLCVVKRKKFLKAIAKELQVCIHDDANKRSYYADGTTERY